MRKILTTLIFTTLVIITVSGQDYKKKTLDEQKYEHYSKMKTRGFTLAIIGGVATASGIILLNQADWNKTTTATSVNYNTSDPSGIVGILLTAAGVPLLITGVIRGAIGNKKEKLYRNKLDNISLGVAATPKVSGFVVVYRF